MRTDLAGADLTPIMERIAAIAAAEGIDPDYALAVAARESGFNPNARASRTIYGLFQMSGPLREQYGVPYGAGIDDQVRGFAAFTRDLRDQMTAYLGRPPTAGELYLAHYWGPQRAASAIMGRGVTFTPQELALNPELNRQDAASRIMADIEARMRNYSPYALRAPSGDVQRMAGLAQPVTGFARFGEPIEAATTSSTTSARPSGSAPLPAAQPAVAGTGGTAAPRFSAFGDPVEQASAQAGKTGSATAGTEVAPEEWQFDEAAMQPPEQV